MEEKSENEKRIRKITKLYYSNPKIMQALVKFAINREVVPRYFEGFGKRPDAIQYPSDIMALVNKGATSFHASEEIWIDPLQINNDLTQERINEMRKGWDLLIDIDSPYFDLSRIAARLVIRALEFHGIKNYGIKFSGSKGLHIIVGWKAFPEEFLGMKTKNMFPEWPRAVTEYLFSWIEPKFREEAGKIMTFAKKDGKEVKAEVFCLNCERKAQKGTILKYRCSVCDMEAERKEAKSSRKLRCMNGNCPGILEIENERDYYFCDLCKDYDNEHLKMDSLKYPENFKEKKGENVSEHAKFDLVLVAPRHLFRMPYSLHEKTSLASVVLTKEELDTFSLRDANALNVEVREFYPENVEGEATKLLKTAIDWKREKEKQREEMDKKYFANYKPSSSGEKGEREYEEIKAEDVKDNYYPPSIKKLLLGLKDGRKRGLFILLTFFRSLNYTPETINEIIKTWNAKNEVPLKEGYVKSQIVWHLKQKKKILPPNYNNDAFYKDLGLIDKSPETKNPLVDVIRKIRENKRS